MLSSNLSVNVGSPGVWVGTPNVVRSFGANVSSPNAYVNYKAVPNLTLWINNLTTPLPSGLVKMLGHSLDVVMPPNPRSSLNPKMKFGRERQTNTINIYI